MQSSCSKTVAEAQVLVEQLDQNTPFIVASIKDGTLRVIACGALDAQALIYLAIQREMLKKLGGVDDNKG